jgi:hypothetical protein
MTVLAVIAILVGALETAAGLQELVVQGILNSRLYPLIGGTLGTVAGAFVLVTGIALFRRSPEARRLAQATAGICIPIFVLIGFIQRLAGWPATILGLALPLILLVVVGRRPHFAGPTAPTAGAA